MRIVKTKPGISEKLQAGLTLFLAFTNITGLLMLATVSSVIAPTYMETFRQKNLALPMITTVLYSVPPMLYKILFLVLATLLGVAQATDKNRKKLLRLQLWSGLGIFILFALFMFALYYPMYGMMSAPS